MYVVRRIFISQVSKVFISNLDFRELSTLPCILQDYCIIVETDQGYELGFFQSARDIINEAEIGTAQADEAENED